MKQSITRIVICTRQPKGQTESLKKDPWHAHEGGDDDKKLAGGVSRMPDLVWLDRKIVCLVSPAGRPAACSSAATVMLVVFGRAGAGVVVQRRVNDP